MMYLESIYNYVAPFFAGVFTVYFLMRLHDFLENKWLDYRNSKRRKKARIANGIDTPNWDKKDYYSFPTTYIQCDCGMELIQLIYEEPDAYNNPLANEPIAFIDFIYVSLYGYGIHSNGKFTLWNRFLMIWYIIRKGKPWADQVILRTDERIKLTNYLIGIENKRLEMIKEAECKSKS